MGLLLVVAVCWRWQWQLWAKWQAVSYSHVTLEPLPQAQHVGVCEAWVRRGCHNGVVLLAIDCVAPSHVALFLFLLSFPFGVGDTHCCFIPNPVACSF